MKRDQTETVQLGAFVREARVAPSDGGDEDRTVDLTFSTGADVVRQDWMGERWVERLSLDPKHVRLDRLNSGAPLLNAHAAFDLDRVLGVVVKGSAEVDGEQGTAKARFSKRDAVEPVWNDVRDGILENVSVGYRVHKFEETTGSDKELPIRTATDWEPFEVSMVPMGADPGAHVREDARREANPCVIVRRVEDEPMTDANKATPAEPVKTRTPDTAPEPTPVSRPRITLDPDTEGKRAAADAERARVLTIGELGARHGHPVEQTAAAQADPKVSVDAFREAILDRRAADTARETEAAQVVTVGDDVADKRRAGIEAWTIAKAGLADLIRSAGEKAPHLVGLKGATDPGEFRGMSLLEMARSSLEAAGIRTAGKDKLELAGLALRAPVLGGQGTSDFAVGLENVLNKVLLAAYTITPDTWSAFCATGTVSDFRDSNRYRTGYLGKLDKVGELSEFKNKTIPDANKEKIAAETFGNIVALSRQAIVNDDMGMFNRVAQQLGRAAALSIESDVYALLALNGGLGPNMNDGNPLFDASHSNIGTASALSVAGIDGDRVTMASQTDPEGNEILDIRPEVLVLPIGLGGEARSINDAQFDTDEVAANLTNKFMKPNSVRGLFRNIVDTARLAGTRRYMFANPAQMPVVEVVFLDGQRTPYLEAMDGWRIDGVEWKVRLDYGVGAIETRGAVTNAGA